MNTKSKSNIIFALSHINHDVIFWLEYAVKNALNQSEREKVGKLLDEAKKLAENARKTLGE